MAYIAQSGIGASLLIDGTTYTVREMSFDSESESIDCSSLTNAYKTFFRGRFGGRLNATILVSADTANDIITSFQNQGALGSPVAFTLTDSSAVNSYDGSGIIEKATHNITGTDVDTLTITMQVTGQYTA